MDNRIEFIEALIKLGLKYGLSSIEADQVKVMLPIKQQEDTEGLAQDVHESPMPSDSDMLFWSTGEELPSDKLTREANE